jgi:hypothetical protein
MKTQKHKRTDEQTHESECQKNRCVLACNRNDDDDNNYNDNDNSNSETNSNNRKNN